MECLQGLRPVDSGRLRVLGLDPGTQARQLRQQIGCQLQKSALPQRIKVWEGLQWFASFSPNHVGWSVLLEQWGLAEKRSATIRTCPVGSANACSWPWPWSTTRSWCSWTR